MGQRSEVHAVYVESLVFESNFGSEGLTANSSNEVTRRAQSVPAGDATALSSENARTVGALQSMISHHVWPGF